MIRPALGALAILATPAAAEAPIPGPVPAEYVDCYDGDTCTVRATPWPDWTVEVSVRVRGVDTPEIRADCPAEKRQAIADRDWLRERLADATITLHDVERGKYAGRVVATVRADGRDVANQLIARDLGRPYDGGDRADWC